LDMAKYRGIFIEESTEHFAEFSSALLELEKDPSSGDAIDVVFRMAHSIKGMAASLEYDSITEIAHRLEDRMQVHRDAGRVPGGDELALLFRGLEGLEGMVAVVRETQEPPGANLELAEALAAPCLPASTPKKKVLIP
jgi:two-component system chemotaxis sensor kinase CheA